MSGIAGIVHFDGRPVEPGQVQAMTSAMDFRGPDGINHWISGSVALGQCMLRTTPESLEEVQPLANEDFSLVLVMDGRIDNREELRRNLISRGAQLRSRSDAELVLRAYETWRERCVERLEGDFAFAIVAPHKRKIFIARDHVGVKPIYVWTSDNSLSFASDPHALLKLRGSPRTFNEKIVAQHLQMTFDDLEETLITNVRRLPPASWMQQCPQRSETRRYWHADRGRIHYRRRQEYVEHFSDVFHAAVKCRIRSPHGIGYYLSGGLDSSTVLSVGATLGAASSRAKSYSLVFPGEDCDESDYIRSMNEATGAEGCLLPGLPVPAEYYFSSMSRLKDICDSPNGAMLNALRSAAQHGGIRVLLTGYGGDEWFGKSPYYYSDLLRTLNFSALGNEVAFSRRNGASTADIANALVFRGLAPLTPHHLKRGIRAIRARLQSGKSDTGYTSIVHHELAYRHPVLQRTESSLRYGNHQTLSYLDSILNSGLNIRGLEIENRTAAIFGVEERSPFYDKRVIEFAFGIPEDQRSRGPGKSLIREAMIGKLPDLVRERRDKAEFSAILAKTLLMPRMKEALDCPRLTAHGWVDPARLNQARVAFEAEYRGGETGYGRYAWPLWMALCLERTYAAIMD